MTHRVCKCYSFCKNKLKLHTLCFVIINYIWQLKQPAIMKNIKFLSAFFILFAAFNLTSCGDTEPIDSTIILPIPTNPGPNPTGDCANPEGFQASGFIDETNINLSWIAGGTETAWEVEYGSIGFDLGEGTAIETTETNITITGLNSANGYNFYVRGICAAGGFSGWVGPISVGTASAACALPTELMAVRNETNLTQATVTWTAGSSVQWEVDYGFVGHTPGTGTLSTTNLPSKTLNNLNTTEGYHVWVRTKCGLDEVGMPVNSYWLGPILIEPINTFSANVDGVAFVPTGTESSLTTVDDVNFISIVSTNEAGDKISLLVRKTLGVGTYNVPADFIASYILDGTEYFVDETNPATLTITAKTPHSIIGTFSFNVLNVEDAITYSVTAGNFAVTF